MSFDATRPTQWFGQQIERRTYEYEAAQPCHGRNTQALSCLPPHRQKIVHEGSFTTALRHWCCGQGDTNKAYEAAHQTTEAV